MATTTNQVQAALADALKRVVDGGVQRYNVDGQQVDNIDAGALVRALELASLGKLDTSPRRGGIRQINMGLRRR